jgi:hypothetical protein
MPCIFRVQKTSKQHDRIEANVPGSRSRRCGCPCHGSRDLDVGITLTLGILDIRLEQPISLQEAITKLSAECDIAFDGGN